MDFVSFLGESSQSYFRKSRLFCLFDGAHSLADVLSRQDHVARLTPEAADVPLLLQRQEGLTLLDLVSAARAVWRRQEGTKKKGNIARCNCSAFKDFFLCSVNP